MILIVIIVVTIIICPCQVTLSLEQYHFGDAGRVIYEFLWDEYADWYIEISKTRLKAGADEEKVGSSDR